jgi:hypothetical protein
MNINATTEEQPFLFNSEANTPPPRGYITKISAAEIELLESLEAAVKDD